MKKISVNISSETLQRIEWSKVYLCSTSPLHFTTTDVIILAVETLYSTLQNESNKKDSKK